VLIIERALQYLDNSAAKRMELIANHKIFTKQHLTIYRKIVHFGLLLPVRAKNTSFVH